MSSCCKKDFLATTVLFVFRVVVGALFCGNIFNWVYRLEPVNVWKPMVMTAMPGIMFYVGTFILTLLYVFVYKTLNKHLVGIENVKKGVWFGLGIWVVGCLPGLWATYNFMTVNELVVIYWLSLGLLQAVVEGSLVAFIIGNSPEACCAQKK